MGQILNQYSIITNMSRAPKLHFRRFEFKYLLPCATADRLIPALLRHMKWDEFATGNKDDRAYAVHSLYYDSPTLKNYYEKMDGIEQRKKFRLRIYDLELHDNSNVFMEYKRKNNIIVNKDRIVHPWKKIYDFLNGTVSIKDFPLEDHKFLTEFLLEKHRHTLKPTVLVSYLRKPLVGHNEDNLRVTFDYNLRAKKVKNISFEPATSVILPDHLIMEVKYNNILPSWLHRIIQGYQLNKDAHSKYCYGVDVTHTLSYI